MLMWPLLFFKFKMFSRTAYMIYHVYYWHTISDIWITFEIYSAIIIKGWSQLKFVFVYILSKCHVAETLLTNNKHDKANYFMSSYYYRG